MRARRSSSRSTPSSAAAHRVDIAADRRRIRSRRRPPPRRSAAAPGDRRHAARGGLDEHDAVTLGLQPAPPVAAQHREHVRAHVQRGEVGVRHLAEQVRTVAQRRRPRVEPATVSSGTGDRDLHVGESGDRVEQHVEPLARDEPAHPDDERADRDRARSAPAPARSASPSSGRNRSGSTPGGITSVGSGRTRRRAPPPAPRTPPPRPARPRRAAPSARACGSPAPVRTP